MAYRGRGQGRGRGGFSSYRCGKPEPFILFPEDVVLPDINDVKEETALVVANRKLQVYWKSAPYYLKKPTKKSKENDSSFYRQSYSESKENDIELYSKLKKEYFPAELFEGKKKVESNQSQGFSSQNNDQLKFDKFYIYATREREFEERESKGGIVKKKENENESDNEEQEDKEESSEETEDDYDKCEIPDDDDDDNPPEDDNPDDDNTYDA